MSTPAAMATVTLVWSGVAFLLTFGAVRLVERLMPESPERKEAPPL